MQKYKSGDIVTCPYDGIDNIEKDKKYRVRYTFDKCTMFDGADILSIETLDKNWIGLFGNGLFKNKN